MFVWRRKWVRSNAAGVIEMGEGAFGVFSASLHELT
jgi:hypothetical protein